MLEDYSFSNLHYSKKSLVIRKSIMHLVLHLNISQVVKKSIQISTPCFWVSQRIQFVLRTISSLKGSLIQWFFTYTFFLA